MKRMDMTNHIPKRSAPVAIDENWCIQRVHKHWYVFPRMNYDAITGQYFGAIVAGATSEQDARDRFERGFANLVRSAK